MVLPLLREQFRLTTAKAADPEADLKAFAQQLRDLLKRAELERQLGLSRELLETALQFNTLQKEIEAFVETNREVLSNTPVLPAGLLLARAALQAQIDTTQASIFQARDEDVRDNRFLTGDDSLFIEALQVKRIALTEDQANRLDEGELSEEEASLILGPIPDLKANEDLTTTEIRRVESRNRIENRNAEFSRPPDLRSANEIAVGFFFRNQIGKATAESLEILVGRLGTIPLEQFRMSPQQFFQIKDAEDERLITLTEVERQLLVRRLLTRKQVRAILERAGNPEEEEE